MDEPDFKRIANILKVVEGYKLISATEHIPPIVSAACLIVEAEGLELSTVLLEYGNQDEDVALVKLADRFIRQTQKEWGSDDFDKIIKMEFDAIRNGAQ